MHDENGLLLPRFDRHESHGRASHCLADRFRVGRVVLTSLNVGLNVVRRHQANLMSKRCELAGPVMRRRAGFHGNQARRQLREERRYLAATQLLTQDDVTIGPYAVKLENVFGEVDANRRDLHVDVLLEAPVPPYHLPVESGWGPSIPSVSGCLPRPRWRSAQPDPHNQSGLEGRSIVQVFKLPFDCQAIFLPPLADFSDPSRAINAVRAISSMQPPLRFRHS